MDTKQEKYVYLGFKSISNPFREKFIKYPNLEKKKTLFLILEYPKHLLVTTVKIWTYRERDFSFCWLKHTFIPQGNSLNRKTFKRQPSHL